MFANKLQKVALQVALLSNIKKYSLKNGTHDRDYDATICAAMKGLTHHFFFGKSRLSRIIALPGFWVDFLLKVTLIAVDVKQMEKKGRWPLRFVGAVCWLALYSWMMLVLVDESNCNVPVLKPALLGITVCAVGTSSPNAVASVLMAKQNQPAAAIADAMGSDGQNVSLGDLHFRRQRTQHLPRKSRRREVWMTGTLLMLVFCTLLSCFQDALPVLAVLWYLLHFHLFGLLW